MVIQYTTSQAQPGLLYPGNNTNDANNNIPHNFNTPSISSHLQQHPINGAGNNNDRDMNDNVNPNLYSNGSQIPQNNNIPNFNNLSNQYNSHNNGYNYDNGFSRNPNINNGNPSYMMGGPVVSGNMNRGDDIDDGLDNEIGERKVPYNQFMSRQITHGNNINGEFSDHLGNNMNFGNNIPQNNEAMADMYQNQGINTISSNSPIQPNNQFYHNVPNHLDNQIQQNTQNELNNQIPRANFINPHGQSLELNENQIPNNLNNQDNNTINNKNEINNKNLKNEKNNVKGDDKAVQKHEEDIESPNIVLIISLSCIGILIPVLIFVAYKIYFGGDKKKSDSKKEKKDVKHHSSDEKKKSSKNTLEAKENKKGDQDIESNDIKKKSKTLKKPDITDKSLTTLKSHRDR